MGQKQKNHQRNVTEKIMVKKRRKTSEITPPI
jgi:hypothetical protein